MFFRDYFKLLSFGETKLDAHVWLDLRDYSGIAHCLGWFYIMIPVCGRISLDKE